MGPYKAIGHISHAQSNAVSKSSKNLANTLESSCESYIEQEVFVQEGVSCPCLLYTSPSPRD